jgi:hypothetical protein
VAWVFSYQLVHIQMLAATQSAPAIRRKKWRNKADRDIVPSGDYETNPPLTQSWRRPFACPWFSDQLVDQVDVVDVFLINA